MPKSSPFEKHHLRYEHWFEKHTAAYVSELLALRAFVPWQSHGLEIGVGTGRFAVPLGVRTGVDPSRAMLGHAAARGLRVVQGVAENLPFAEGRFDFVLVVTTLCFVESPAKLLAEAKRVLKPGGRLIIGFIDRDSPLGQEYERQRPQSIFYSNAVFFSAREVEQFLMQSGYLIEDWGQTLALPLAQIRNIESMHPGYGRGAFVVVSAQSGS